MERPMMGVGRLVACRVPRPFVKSPVSHQVRFVSHQAVRPVMLDVIEAAGTPPDAHFIDVPSPAVAPWGLTNHKLPCTLVRGLRRVVFGIELFTIVVHHPPPRGVCVDTSPMMPVRIPEAT